MADYSFDVVPKADLNLIEEAVNTALKEITNRYDFKDSNSNIELNGKDNTIKLSSADDFKVKALDFPAERLSKKLGTCT